MWRWRPLQAMEGKGALWSVLETVSVASTDRRVAYLAKTHFEAPNWSRDGSFLLVNRSEAGEGRIVHLDWHAKGLLATGPRVLPSGAQVHWNNDHGLSPDNKEIAFSDNSVGDHSSRVYVMPVEGGTPRQLTPTGPSYWHGWSPDGKTLAFVGQRAGEFDIYTVPASGGTEHQMTTAKGLDDGPEYAPDGKTIFFCSVRSGHMQLWQMDADGGNQRPLLTDETDDWFPHVLAGRQASGLCGVSVAHGGAPAGQGCGGAGAGSRDARDAHGGEGVWRARGTMNVPSWAPDSQRLAFVSYEYLPASETEAP